MAKQAPKATATGKAANAVKKEPVKAPETPKAETPEVIEAKEETPGAIAPEQPEQSEETGTQEAPGEQPGEEKPYENPERPPYDLTPQEQSEEQRAYVEAFNKYTDLHGRMPDETLSTAELNAAIAIKQDEIDNTPSRVMSVTEQEAAGLDKARKSESDKNYVVIENKKTGERTRIKRRTWDLLKKAPGQFREVPNIPAEVSALRKGGK